MTPCTCVLRENVSVRACVFVCLLCDVYALCILCVVLSMWCVCLGHHGPTAGKQNAYAKAWRTCAPSQCMSMHLWLACVHVRACHPARTYLRVCAGACVCVCVCARESVCVCVCACMCACTHAHIHLTRFSIIMMISPHTLISMNQRSRMHDNPWSCIHYYNCAFHHLPHHLACKNRPGRNQVSHNLINQIIFRSVWGSKCICRGPKALQLARSSTEMVFERKRGMWHYRMEKAGIRTHFCETNVYWKNEEGKKGGSAKGSVKEFSAKLRKT